MPFNRKKIEIKNRLKIQPNKRRKKPQRLVDPRTKVLTARRERLKKDIERYITKKRKKIEKVKIRKKHCDNRKFKPLSKWENLLRGQPIFILGNSPSLNEQPLALLDPYFTLGINRIFYIYQPTVLLWQDRQMWRTNRDDILSTKAIRICRDIVDNNKIFLNYYLGLDPFRITGKPHRLYGRGNTGSIAVQFAVALGCSSIVLLGTDCKYGPKGLTDFYGNNKDHSKFTIDMCKRASKWIKKECPVPIYNCSKNKCWPQRELKDVLEILKPKKRGRKYFIDLFSK